MINALKDEEDWRDKWADMVVQRRDGNRPCRAGLSDSATLREQGTGEETQRERRMHSGLS